MVKIFDTALWKPVDLAPEELSTVPQTGGPAADKPTGRHKKLIPSCVVHFIKRTTVQSLVKSLVLFVGGFLAAHYFSLRTPQLDIGRQACHVAATTARDLSLPPFTNDQFTVFKLSPQYAENSLSFKVPSNEYLPQRLLHEIDFANENILELSKITKELPEKGGYLEITQEDSEAYTGIQRRIKALNASANSIISFTYWPILGVPSYCNPLIQPDSSFLSDFLDHFR